MADSAWTSDIDEPAPAQVDEAYAAKERQKLLNRYDKIAQTYSKDFYVGNVKLVDVDILILDPRTSESEKLALSNEARLLEEILRNFETDKATCVIVQKRGQGIAYALSKISRAQEKEILSRFFNNDMSWFRSRKLRDGGKVKWHPKLIGAWSVNALRWCHHYSLASLLLIASGILLAVSFVIGWMLYAIEPHNALLATIPTILTTFSCVMAIISVDIYDQENKNSSRCH